MSASRFYELLTLAAAEVSPQVLRTHFAVYRKPVGDPNSDTEIWQAESSPELAPYVGLEGFETAALEVVCARFERLRSKYSGAERR